MNDTRGLTAFVRRHDLLCYFALAYGISWSLWAPYVLSGAGLGILPLHFPRLLGDEQLAGLVGAENPIHGL